MDKWALPALQQAVAGFPGAGQTGLYRQYSQKPFATGAGQQAMLEVSTEWPGLRNRTNPGLWARLPTSPVYWPAPARPAAACWSKVLLATAKKLTCSSQERWQLEVTLCFTLHRHGDRTANKVDMAVTTQGHSQWPLSGQLLQHVLWQHTPEESGL